MKSKTIRIIGAAVCLVILVAFFSSRMVLLASERDHKASQALEADSAIIMEHCSMKMKSARPAVDAKVADNATTNAAPAADHCANCSKHKQAQ
ncbi:hypothetical protein DB345_17425 [Spartobacteria bacterium LR76]|nr:hypothetical protein DB345_17425 [Spartobacteria bacterium LR76]